MKNWFIELRVTHYLKNCLLFVPAFFGGVFMDGFIWKTLTITFVCFCMGASAVYLMNDIKDIEKDRVHPKKKNRPIAAGKITIKNAAVAAVILLALSYAGIIVLIDAGVRVYALAVFSGYMLINILYSLAGFKKIPLMDVAILVLGFYLRVLMGSVLIGVKISSWLYLVVITGAFYLAFGKRRNEMKFAGSGSREALQGYTESFLEKAMYACMTMTNIYFALWCIQAEERHNYIMLVPILMMICFKYSMDIEQDNCDGDPMNVILQDKVLLLLGFVFTALIALLIYRGK